MAKAVGIGGVFFKANDPKALSQWYEANLGIGGRVSGDTLTFDGPGVDGNDGVCPIPGEYEVLWRRAAVVHAEFPSGRSGWLAGEARSRRGAHRSEATGEGYGRFAWIWDPEGNRIELWEPAGESEG